MGPLLRLVEEGVVPAGQRRRVRCPSSNALPPRLSARASLRRRPRLGEPQEEIAPGYENLRSAEAMRSVRSKATEQHSLAKGGFPSTRQLDESQGRLWTHAAFWRHLVSRRILIDALLRTFFSGRSKPLGSLRYQAIDQVHSVLGPAFQRALSPPLLSR